MLLVGWRRRRNGGSSENSLSNYPAVRPFAFAAYLPAKCALASQHTLMTSPGFFFTLNRRLVGEGDVCDEQDCCASDASGRVSHAARRVRLDRAGRLAARAIGQGHRSSSTLPQPLHLSPTTSTEDARHLAPAIDSRPVGCLGPAAARLPGVRDLGRPGQAAQPARGEPLHPGPARPARPVARVRAPDAGREEPPERAQGRPAGLEPALARDAQQRCRYVVVVVRAFGRTGLAWLSTTGLPRATDRAPPQACRPSTNLIGSLPRTAEYVLTGLDKIVNWARQGSMWPMTCASASLCSFRARSAPVVVPAGELLTIRRHSLTFLGLHFSRPRLLRRRDDVRIYRLSLGRQPNVVLESQRPDRVARTEMPSFTDRRAEHAATRSSTGTSPPRGTTRTGSASYSVPPPGRPTS
jgi:hypothetical protein